MEQVEQFVIYMAASELDTFICEHETCPVASKFKSSIIGILNYCKTNYIENIYVVEFKERGTAAQERTNILQGEDDEIISLEMPMQIQEEDKEEQKKEDDKSISLGMPMQPQEEDKEEQVEEE